MAIQPNRGERGSGYLFKFVATASLLVGGTLALVLYVLPERYVLSSGFREGNLNLPTPSIPFRPAPPLRIAAIPDIPDGTDPRTDPGVDSGEVPRGPSEIFWERVGPLLEAERWAEAIPLFTDYLARYPGDLGVRREYAITLAAAGYRDRAIPILRGLLEYEDDAELHLLLARALRDEGRVAEASDHYRLLLARSPDDEALVLEWARALSWAFDYGAAEALLRDALEREPDSVALRAELARVHYYAGDIELAQALIDSLTEQQIRDEELSDIRANLVEWLTPPDEPAVAPPSMLELAARAREADDFELADSLFRATVADTPDDPAAWRAYADFLQYELGDFTAALDALREAERLEGDDDAALQFRMAQLEIWTDQTAEAQARLEALLAAIDRGPGGRVPPDPASAAPPGRADVLALLGDLHRWSGRRFAAVGRYEEALAADPDNEVADAGLSIIAAEVDRQLVQTEQPGLGAIASSFVDTDEYRRFDAGGEWTGVHGVWVWSTRSGGRWLEGLEPGGGPGDRQGVFAELEGARWWRWGTVRTAGHLSVQTVRSNAVDVGVGASARVVSGSGGRTDVRFDHEPALLTTNTLQSVASDVRQDRLTVSHSRPLGERWSIAATAEVASIEHRDVAGADRNLRTQLGASVGRSVTETLTLGLGARALRYRDAAPDMTAIRLYWDPRLNVSAGPYLQLVRPLGSLWELTGRVSPGVAYLDERLAGTSLVPEISGRVGLVRDGPRYRTGVELYYGQGRLDGYRSFGVELSFAARGWFGPGIGR